MSATVHCIAEARRKREQRLVSELEQWRAAFPSDREFIDAWLKALNGGAPSRARVYTGGKEA